MEVRRVVCGVLLVALMVSGSNAQLSECGTAPLNTRIVGGQDAPAGSWPWQAGVYVLGMFNCGGSLINNEWVLTSAQCVYGATASAVTVKLGSDAQQSPSPNEVTRKVSQLIVHSGFDVNNLNNDIALLKLSSPVNFNNYIRPVCLAASGSDFKDGSSCWIAGWGRINTGTPLPNPGKLKQVSVPIVSNSECKKLYTFLTNNHMCTGSTAGGKGICIGDAGSPLVMKGEGNKWIQAGVAAFINAAGCGKPSSPDGYIRVSMYESWIKSKISTNQPGFIYSGAARSLTLSVPLLLSILLVFFSVFVR